MTDIEIKGKELIEKFDALDDNSNDYTTFYHNSKACALICVDEILDQQPLNPNYWEAVRAYIEGSK